MTSLKCEYLPKRCNLVYACFVGTNCQVISGINDGKLKYLFLEFESLSIFTSRPIQYWQSNIYLMMLSRQAYIVVFIFYNVYQRYPNVDILHIDV